MFVTVDKRRAWEDKRPHKCLASAEDWIGGLNRLQKIESLRAHPQIFGAGAYDLNTIEFSPGIAGIGPLILFVDSMSETRPSKMCLESRDSQGNGGSLDQSIGDLQ